MRPLKPIPILAMMAAAWAGLCGNAAENASAKDDYAWMRGANYVPSYAKNDVALWLDFDSEVIGRELGYAERLKLNTVRVFLSVQAYERNPPLFLERFEQFLTLCAKHKIQMMPVLFDSCFDPQEVDLAEYRDKNWIPSPGCQRLGEKDWPAMETYTAAIVGKHKQDPRIVLWDVMNEPESTGEFGKPEGKARIVGFVRRAIARVRQEGPVQPLGVGWAFSRNISLSADITDVLILHNYANPQGLGEDIRRIRELGKSLNKPAIINEWVGRPQQRIEEAMPVVAKEKIGWVFWELMLGKTQFTQGRRPYQGHIYPDGTCYSAKEVAAILSPEGYTGSVEEVIAKAGFKVSDKAAKSFTEEGITFSPLWERWNGVGPTDNRLWFAADANETAVKEVEGADVVLVMKFGPDCGIATVTVDGKPAPVPEIDTYSKEVDWNRRVVVAENLTAGLHRVVITVTGRKAAEASNRYVQLEEIVKK
ncbi:MAG: cellulase family glycosylhydrolase [bacterium]